MTPIDERVDDTAAATPALEPRRRGLGALVRTGIRWKVVSSIVVQATRTVTAIVIARLVTPEEFGLAALVLVFSTLAVNLTDLSLGAALVQRRTITEADRSTAFWTSTGMGVVLTLVFLALSWPMARFYDEPAVQPLLALYSITFLLNGLATTQATLLSRDLRFRSLELRIIVATLVAAPVGIVVAALGGGAWAIILQALAYSVVSLPLLWAASPWRPSLVYSLRSLRGLGGFGLNVFAAQIVRFVSRTADTILIGRFLGSASVGAYSIGLNLTRIPLYRVVAPLQSITFPAFSRVQSDRATLAEGWLRATSLVALLVAPATLGMMVVAPDFVGVVLGERWLDAIPVVQALSWVALLSSLQQIGVVSVLLALDRSGTSLRITVATTAANVAAFAAGLPWGIVGVSVAYAAVTTAITPVAVLIVLRAVGSPARAYVDHVLPPLAAAGIMAGGVLALRLAMPGDLLPDAVRLVLLVGAGALCYLLLAARLVPEAVGELRRLLPSRRHRAGAPAGESLQPD